MALCGGSAIEINTSFTRPDQDRQRQLALLFSWTSSAKFRNAESIAFIFVGMIFSLSTPLRARVYVPVLLDE